VSAFAALPERLSAFGGRVAQEGGADIPTEWA
jgi:hypothetical protein